MIYAAKAGGAASPRNFIETSLYLERWREKLSPRPADYMP